jgi:hypothetical protein
LHPFKNDEKGNYIPEYAKFTPKDVNTIGPMIFKKRYIGVFEVPWFTAEISIKWKLEGIAAYHLQMKGTLQALKYSVMKLSYLF